MFALLQRLVTPPSLRFCLVSRSTRLETALYVRTGLSARNWYPLLDELLLRLEVDATLTVPCFKKSSNQMIDFDIEQVKRRECASNLCITSGYAHARI